jgi:hypothetical protein
LTSDSPPQVSVRAIAISLVIALAILGGFNVLVRYFARNTVPRQVIRSIDSSRGVTYLALGNSLIAAGFSATAFDEAMRPETMLALNAGLGATSPVQHLEILREALRHDPAIKFVIYGFFDFQLSNPPIVTNADLIGNYACSYYLEPEIALRYYQMGLGDRLEFEVMRRVPMLAERGAIWEKIELIRRAMGAIGMPTQRTNRFGRAVDFNMLEARSRKAFVSSCDRWSEPTAQLSRPIMEIIRESRAHGAKVIFVEMPMHPFHQKNFYALRQWGLYRTRLRSLIEQTGSEYVNASNWIENPDEFADHLHLAPSGAQEFSRRLAMRLRSVGAASDRGGVRAR